MPVGVRAGIAAMSQIDRSLDEASLVLRAPFCDDPASDHRALAGRLIDFSGAADQWKNSILQCMSWLGVRDWKSQRRNSPTEQEIKRLSPDPSWSPARRA